MITSVYPRMRIGDLFVLRRLVQFDSGHILEDSLARQIADGERQRADHKALCQKTCVDQLKR